MADLMVGVGLMTAVTAGVMLATMLFTYTSCVALGHCPALPHLPTISNTWDNAPGNYLSRFVVGNVAFNFSILQPVLWHNERNGWFFVALGVIATFCLSVVGAVCDDDNGPQCRGNNTVHTAAAVSFFVLYNMNMIILTVREGRWRVGWLALPVVLSTLCKSRWLLAAPEDQTVLAVVEWSDVLLIMLWTVHFVFVHRPGYRIGLKLSATVQGERVLFLPATLMTVLAGLLYFGTLLISLFFVYHEHRVAKGTLPYISDMWVYPPGNWLSRWAIIQGGILMLFVHICVWALDKGRVAVLLVALAAILGLDLVGCVDESECWSLHVIGAVAYFGGYDVYMLLRSFIGLSKAEVVTPGQAALVGLAICSCMTTWLRWGGALF